MQFAKRNSAKVVSTLFIDKCINSGTLLDPSPFIVAAPEVCRSMVHQINYQGKCRCRLLGTQAKGRRTTCTRSTCYYCTITMPDDVLDAVLDPDQPRQMDHKRPLIRKPSLPTPPAITSSKLHTSNVPKFR